MTHFSFNLPCLDGGDPDCFGELPVSIDIEYEDFSVASYVFDERHDSLMVRLVPDSNNWPKINDHLEPEDIEHLKAELAESGCIEYEIRYPRTKSCPACGASG